MNKDEILKDLTNFQPLLDILNADNDTIVYGTYQINESLFGEPFFDNFDVKITFTSNYPNDIPLIYVHDNRLDKCEHRNANDTLCLEAVHVLKEFLFEKPTLKDFLIKFLTPFLAGFLFFEKYGEYPFGERCHGDSGIFQLYEERFHTKELSVALQLLKIVALKQYKGHILCPCNSGERIRNCHGKNNLLINMINSPNQKFYAEDYNALLTNYLNSRKNK